MLRMKSPPGRGYMYTLLLSFFSNSGSATSSPPLRALYSARALYHNHLGSDEMPSLQPEIYALIAKAVAADKTEYGRLEPLSSQADQVALVNLLKASPVSDTPRYLMEM